MTFTINWGKNGVSLKFRGIITDQDLIDANNYIISNASFESINYQIFDFSDIEDFKVTSYDISIIGILDKSQVEFTKDMKVAFVTQDDYVKDIVSEFDQILASSKWVSKTFPTLEDAKKWVKTK